MSDKINSFTIVLEEDLTKDQAMTIITAISTLRGVLSVESNVACSSDYLVAECRVRRDIEKRIWDAMKTVVGTGDLGSAEGRIHRRSSHE